MELSGKVDLMECPVDVCIMQSDIMLRQALILNLACAAGLKMSEHPVAEYEGKEAEIKHEYLLFKIRCRSLSRQPLL